MDTANCACGRQCSNSANCMKAGRQHCVKKVKFNAMHNLPNWVLGASLASLVPEAQRQFVPPWPDLVVAAGKRTVPITLWIKAASGGRTKLIQIGRPRAALAHFDLVISTPQYGLPKEPNVIELVLPFTSPEPVSRPEISYWLRRMERLTAPLDYGIHRRWQVSAGFRSARDP